MNQQQTYEVNKSTNKMANKDGGCHVSGAMGAMLVLLAILVSLGVGLIVHFAENDRELVCQLDPQNNAGSSVVTGGSDVTKTCQDLAGQGNSIAGLICKLFLLHSNHRLINEPHENP